MEIRKGRERPLQHKSGDAPPYLMPGYMTYSHFIELASQIVLHHPLVRTTPSSDISDTPVLQYYYRFLYLEKQPGERSVSGPGGAPAARPN
jgi:hypothetical protein